MLAGFPHAHLFAVSILVGTLPDFAGDNASGFRQDILAAIPLFLPQANASTMLPGDSYQIATKSIQQHSSSRNDSSRKSLTHGYL